MDDDLFRVREPPIDFGTDFEFESVHLSLVVNFGARILGFFLRDCGPESFANLSNAVAIRRTDGRWEDALDISLSCVASLAYSLSKLDMGDVILLGGDGGNCGGGGGGIFSMAMLVIQIIDYKSCKSYKKRDEWKRIMIKMRICKLWR